MQHQFPASASPVSWIVWQLLWDQPQPANSDCSAGAAVCDTCNPAPQRLVRERPLPGNVQGAPVPVKLKRGAITRCHLLYGVRAYLAAFISEHPSVAASRLCNKNLISLMEPAAVASVFSDKRCADGEWRQGGGRRHIQRSDTARRVGSRLASTARSPWGQRPLLLSHNCFNFLPCSWRRHAPDLRLPSQHADLEAPQGVEPAAMLTSTAACQ